jgi:hypothetical protein
MEKECQPGRIEDTFKMIKGNNRLKELLHNNRLTY